MSSDEKLTEAAQFLEAARGLEAVLARRQAEGAATRHAAPLATCDR
jgi:hypothetical protein